MADHWPYEGRKVVVVGTGNLWAAVGWNVDVRFVSPQYYEEGRAGISAKKRGAEHAMYNAVKVANPGDLILQHDMRIPKQHVIMLDAPRELGHKVIMHCDPWLNPYPIPGQPIHWCPRAFVIGSEETKEQLLMAWNPNRENIPMGEYACLAWEHIPKVQGEVFAYHE